MEEKNKHLQTLLKKKKTLSSLSSSGVESLSDITDKEHRHVKAQNKASGCTDLTKKVTDIIDNNNVVSEQIKHNEAEPKTVLQSNKSYENQSMCSTICNAFDINSRNEAVSEQELNEDIQDIEEFLPTDLRQLHQLYGKDFNEDGETMVLLRNNIFCKSSVLKYALGSSTKTTHLVRKLVLGVFKEEIFKKGQNEVTLTGNALRILPGGKQPGVTYFGIDVVAKSAIIKYAKAVAKYKKWPHIRTKDLERTLSQRIGEIKRDYTTE